ncbi:MAG: ABC transporter ATP-binding protein [Coriobacteriales bacterium]|jgi:ABC-2 type transport system ATP-binding protein|nr:ABC transporter ATP-binding protein [Coriobacteriales bacterium]
MRTENPAFTLEGVTLRYPGKPNPALDNITLSIEHNSICGLLGRNAAGKTSLMSLLAAYRKPSAGQVKVFGENPYENPRISVNVVLSCLRTDKASYYETSKPRELFQLASMMRPHWDQAFCNRLVERFELPLKRRLSKLSQGQKAATSCILGLASRAPLTIFDEAYLGMDAVYRRAFVDELLADYLEHPRTILFSTHYISEMERLFSEVIIIDDGRVLVHDDADTLRAQGVSVTGSAEAVDRLVGGRQVLAARSLGGTKEAVLLGLLDERERQAAEQAGLSIGQPTLEDLFIHLTSKEGD